MYKNIIFDLDGTLLDSTIGVTKAVRITLEQLGLPMLHDDVLKLFVGPPMQSSFMSYFGMDFDKALECANIFRENYKKYSLFDAVLYPGVLDLLKALKRDGRKIAIATNKSHNNAINILEHFDILQYCDFAMGSDLKGNFTKTYIVNECIKFLGADRSFTVLIGDSSLDSKGANEAGIDFIALTYGFGFKSSASLQNIPRIAECSSINELARFLSIIL